MELQTFLNELDQHLDTATQRFDALEIMYHISAYSATPTQQKAFKTFLDEGREALREAEQLVKFTRGEKCPN
jgi:hypothetical protein